MHIGIAGIGKMGVNIGLRLLEVGHRLSAWNRTASRLEPLIEQGATAVATPAELVASAEIVLTSLTDQDAINAVYLGQDGLLAGNVSRTLFIEMSTLSPSVQIDLSKRVREKGGAYVECPVSGSVVPARSGSLIGLVGADPADAARARPLLDQLCRRVVLAGPVGSGSVLKLAVNLPLLVYWQALGEQLSLCRSLTMDAGELLEFLSETAGAATGLKLRMPSIVRKLKNETSGQASFNLDGGIKEANQLLALGHRLDLELPLLKQTLACYEEARHAFGGQEEISHVSAYWAARKTPR